MAPSTPSACESCGMLMKLEQRAGGRAESVFCLYCTSPQGELKPRDTVREGMVRFFMRSQKLDRARAERLVDAHMTRMPAWASESKARATIRTSSTKKAMPQKKAAAKFPKRSHSNSAKAKRPKRAALKRRSK